MLALVPVNLALQIPSASLALLRSLVPSGQATLADAITQDTQGLRRRLTGSSRLEFFGVFLPGKEKAPSLLARPF